jgi:hypothetical protein
MVGLIRRSEMEGISSRALTVREVVFWKDSEVTTLRGCTTYIGYGFCVVGFYGQGLGHW